MGTYSKFRVQVSAFYKATSVATHILGWVFPVSPYVLNASVTDVTAVLKPTDISLQHPPVRLVMTANH